MRIVFIGASELGYNCCEACIASGHNVVGIITLQNEFSIKYKEQKDRVIVKNVLFKDFREFEEKYNIPVVVAQHPVTEAYAEISVWKPDLIIVIGWYYMIPEKTMAIPTKGVVGIHGSLLPKYRGNAPFVWAMINGEKETGVSLFYIEKGTDEGDIIEQKAIPIEEDDYIDDILKKAEAASTALLQKNLSLIAADAIVRKPQDHSKATYFPKRTPEDGQIDWDWDGQRIINFIKAQSKPYPGAFTIINKKQIIIWNAEIKNI